MHLIGSPDVGGGNDRIGLVKTAHRDVDRVRLVVALKGERRAAGAAKAPYGLRSGAQLARHAGGEREGSGGNGCPRDEWRPTGASADGAMAMRDLERRRRDSVAQRAAEAAAAELRGHALDRRRRRRKLERPTRAIERRETVATVETGGARVVALDLEIDGHGAGRARRIERGAQQRRANPV